MSGPIGRDPQALSRDALAAAHELTSGDSALAGVLRELADVLREPATDAERGRHERELMALVLLAGVVGGAHRIEDVVEIAADRARDAIDAASMSVSRWEADGQALRTLVNVGELGPGEVRSPEDEVYRLEDSDLLRLVLERGRAYRVSLDDPEAHPLERRLLRDLGKQHCAGVGIRFAGRPWGELWATRRADQEPFSDRDVRFMHTITAMIAAAAARSEVFARMAEMAYEDPLTGVSNRRALEEHLELATGEAVAAGRDLALLLCDLDGLKELNDRHGHAAGDAALARVADELGAAAGAGSLVARIGGDEFCVVLDGRTADEAQAVGEDLLVRLSVGAEPRLSASVGVASIGLGARRPGDLLRAADAAQYTAKRSGRGRVALADTDADASWRTRRAERRAIRGRDHAGTVDVGTLLAEALDELDGPAAGRSVLDRLEAVVLAVGAAVEATAVAVSRRPADGAEIETAFSLDRRTGRSTGDRFGIEGPRFAATEFPRSVELMAQGGSDLILAGDEQADPAERAMLADYGMSGVLVAGRPGADGCEWLVEVFADGQTGLLGDVEPALRLLVGEAVGPRPG